jgi:hypothetical protein
MSETGNGRLAYIEVQACHPQREGQWMRMIGSVNLRIFPTLVNDSVVQCLGLPAVEDETFREIETGNTYQLYRVKLKIGSHAFDTQVVKYPMSLPAVIGSDLVARAVASEPSLLFDLFNDPLVRALTAAARSMRKTVLLIGSYGDGVASLLKEVKACLEVKGFIGALLVDYPDIKEQSLPQKMLLFGSISRFVICLDLRPSGHIAELETCARAGFVTAVLRSRQEGSTWMQDDIAARHTFMKVFEYVEQDLESTISSALSWGESKVQELAASHDSEYPWKNRNVRLAPDDG